MSVLNEFEELRQFMHVEEAPDPAPAQNLVADTVAVYQGRLCVIVSVRKDGDVTAVSEDGNTVHGKTEEFAPLSDEELFAFLEERRKNSPAEPEPEEVEVRPRITPPPPGGNLPAPPPEAQKWVRVCDRRWSRNGFPQATISLLGDFVQFDCTVFGNEETTLPGNEYGRVQVFWGRENKSRDLVRSIARRIVRGQPETNVIDNPPENLVLRVVGGISRGKNGKIGSGILKIVAKPMTITVPYTIFEKEDGYSVAIPSFNWRDTIGFYVLNQRVNSDIKGAILIGWCALTGNKPRVTRPASGEGKHPRACGSCRHHVRIGQGSRSTYDITREGEMVPCHFCVNPKVKVSEHPIPIDFSACVFGNKSLAQYGRNVKEWMSVWVTPHQRGKTQTLRSNDIWMTVCPLHTYKDEVDFSHITVDSKHRAHITIVSRPSRQDDAAPTSKLRIPVTW